MPDSSPDAIQFAQAIMDQDLFSDYDTTPVTGNDVKAEFWADCDERYEYQVIVRRQRRIPSDDFERSGGHAAGEQLGGQ